MVTKTIFVHVDRLSRTPRPRIFFFLPAGTADGSGRPAGGGENSFSSGVESASRKSSWGILFAVGRIITAGGRYLSSIKHSAATSQETSRRGLSQSAAQKILFLAKRVLMA